MKRWIVVAVVICAPGSYPFKDTCVVDIPTEIALPVKPSDEKPPRDKIPSYQREGITLAPVKDMAEDDRKQDRENAKADSQGKRSAGLK